MPDSGYKNCVCCGEIFVSNGTGDDYCASCIEAQCQSYHEHGMSTECQKPICGCGEHMELGVNGEFECFNDCSRFHIGAEVYWNDPDEGKCSGYYTIVEIVPAGSETVFKMKNSSGSQTEAYIHECD